MSLAPERIHALAHYLDHALLEGREVPRLTEQEPSLSLDDAYRIQDEGIRLRLARGERPLGLKMGLTSRAKMEQMNLRQPIYGVLTDRMEVLAGGTYSLKGQIHPKIEPEIAFRIGRELRGKVTPEQALAACDGVGIALEILDSRFVGFKYFSLPDVVADNCSSAQFVVAPTFFSRDHLSIDELANLEMSLEIDGQVAHTAKSGEILGNPLNSLTYLCDLLQERGLALPAGALVLAGAATQAVQLAPGMRARLTVQKLGSVEVGVARDK